MKNRLLFLGPPGAGKGTQASLTCKDQGLLHLSTGDLLRDEVSSGTKLGQEVDSIMNQGELVSDQIVLSIVEKKLSHKNHGWLLDGFPRNLVQADLLEHLLNKIGQPIDIVILLEIDDKTLTERMLSRGRKDDNEEVIRNRLEVYRNKTSPLVDFYRDLGLLRSINGCGSVEDVKNLIKEELN